MRHSFFIPLVLSFLISVAAGAEPALKTIRSTAESLDVRIDISDKIAVREIETDGVTYQKIEIKEDGFREEGVYPQIEHFAKGYLFAVPAGANPAVSFTVENKLELKQGKLVPARKARAGADGIVTYLYNKAEKTFAVEKEAVSLIDCGPYQGNNLYRLLFNPLLLRGERAELITRLRIRIDFGSRFPRVTGKALAPKDGYLGKLLLNNTLAALNKRSVGSRGRFDTFLDSDSELIKLTVTEEGIYKVSGSQIADLGFDLSSVSPDRISVYSGAGEELPFYPDASLEEMYHGAVEVSRKVIDLDNDGNFDSDDYILFYGQAPSGWKRAAGSFKHYFNRYSHQNFYWINPGISASSPAGKVMEEIEIAPSSDHAEVQNFTRMEFFEDRKDVLVDYHIPSWYSSMLGAGDTRTFDLPLADISPESKVLINIEYQKNISSSARMTYLINSKEIDTSNSESPNFIIENPHNYFNENSINRLSFRNTSSNKENFLESYEVLYHGKIDAAGKNGIFFGAELSSDQYYQFNFEHADGQLLYDISDPVNVKTYPLSVQNGSGLSTCSYQASADINYFLLNSSSFKTARQMEKIGQRIPENGEGATLHAESGSWDMVIVSPAEFYPYLNDDTGGLIAAHKKHNGADFSIKVVSMTDISNEFGRGYQEPAATRNFIRFAHESWGVEYVLLAGDGTYDPRNEDNYDVKNYIYPADPLKSTFGGSDSYYGNLFNGKDSGVQHVAVGRFTVDNLTELKQTVEKNVAYMTEPDLSSWRSTVLFLGDDEKNGDSGGWRETYHITDIEKNLAPIIPSSYIMKKVYLTEYPFVYDPAISKYLKPEAETELIRVLNEGVSLFCYLGHGSPRQLAHEKAFIPASFDKLNNYKKYHLMMGGTCHFGVFDHPLERGLGEEMLVAPNRGAIALFNATRGSYPNGNRNLFSNIFNALFDNNGDRPTIGKALQLGKTQLGGLDAAMYMLFGNPALKIFKDYEVLKGADKVSLATLSLDSVQATVSDTSALDFSDFTGTLNMVLTDAEIERRYFNSEHWDDEIVDTLRYTLPGNRIISTISSMDKGSGTSRFVLPKDLNYGDTGAKISMYAFNEELELTGSIDTVAITGSQGGRDSIPPLVAVKYNSLNYQDGDPVGSNAVVFVEMYDENGINTSGGIGHKMLMEVDGKEIELNNYFTYYVDSYQKGYARYQLIGLSEGKHIIKASAWDTYNNYSEAVSEIDIVSENTPEDGWIGNIVNYPNPLNGEGTTFTFNAHNQIELSSFRISIYTINGRKIKVLDSSAINFNDSYQTLKWDGRDDDGDYPANGIYFYKVDLKYNGKSVNAIEKLMIAR